MAKISVVTAFHNEQESLPAFRARLTSVLESLDVDWEVVLVDDHSGDASTSQGRQWVRDDTRVQYLRLSRNFGSHAAFSAGLSVAKGDCAALLAADLQDPPETLEQLLAQWRAGNEVVWAVRSGRLGEAWTTKLFAGAYYWLMRRVALPEMPSTGADFLLLDRKVIDAYNAIGEKNTSFLAMILWMGFRQCSIEYVKQERHAGRSKWTWTKKVKLCVDSLVSFSYAPIRGMSYLGLAMALLGFIYASVVVVGRFIGFIVEGTGFAALMTVLLVGQGIIMMMLGTLGEYLWRTFDECRGRPRFIIQEHLTSASADSESKAPTASSASSFAPPSD